MAKKKTGLMILMSVIIVAILVLFINLFVSYVYPSPDYEDYCSARIVYPGQEKPIENNDSCEALALSQRDQCCADYYGTSYYWDEDLEYCECDNTYDEARTNYDQKVFFIFAGLGFILLIAGLFINFTLVEIISLSTGGILVIEGIARNFDDKLMVLIATGVLIVIVGIFAFKKFKD